MVLYLYRVLEFMSLGIRAAGLLASRQTVHCTVSWRPAFRGQRSEHHTL